MPNDSPAAGPGPCPYCGEAIASLARNCPQCDEDLSGVLAAELSLAIERDTREDAAQGRFDPEPGTAFRRFRTITIVVGAVLTVGLVLIAVTWGKAASSPALTTTGWVASIVCVIPFLVLGIHDLLLKSPERLTTPRSVYETYVKCIREKRWSYGLSLVVPRGREGERRRPAIEAIKVTEGSFAVDTPEGFSSFWNEILHSGGPVIRTFRAGAIHLDETGPDTAVAGCNLKVTAYPRWVSLLVLCYLLPAVIAYLILRKTEEIPLDMPLMKVKGRWYVVDAVPAIPLRQEAN